jgi:tetratricopeptide (TPR) repeat protein
MFIQQYPGDELTRAAQFNLGRAYEQAGRFQEAMVAYRDSILPDDPINVYIYQRIGNVGLQTTAYTDTISAYQAGIASTADRDLQHLLREGIAQAELSRQNPDGAIAQYEAILNESQDDEYRAKMLRLAGEAYLAKGDTEAAYQRYQEAVNNYYCRF